MIGILAVIAMTALSLTKVSDHPQRNWDMSLPWSLAEYHTTNAMRFAEEAARVTDGRVTITVHIGAVLGIKGPDSLRALENNVVALAEMAGFQQTGSEPILGLEALPFLVDDLDELYALYENHLRPHVEQAFSNNGLKLLYIVPWPNQYLYTRVRGDTISDFQGLKVRTLDKNTTDFMERLGFTPIQMPSPDVVPALASGAIDATMTSATTGVAQKYWEFLDTAYATNHNWASNMMAVSQMAWESLSAEDQAALETLARTLEPQFWEIAKADDARTRAILIANGMQIIRPSDTMREQMKSVARPMWREFARSVPQAESILDGYLAATGRAPLEATP